MFVTVTLSIKVNNLFTEFTKSGSLSGKVNPLTSEYLTNYTFIMSHVYKFYQKHPLCCNTCFTPPIKAVEIVMR